MPFPTFRGLEPALLCLNFYNTFTLEFFFNRTCYYPGSDRHQY
jgi:hypothetical protein